MKPDEIKKLEEAYQEISSGITAPSLMYIKCPKCGYECRLTLHNPDFCACLEGAMEEELGRLEKD